MPTPSSTPTFQHSQVPVRGSSLHVVEAGPKDGPAYLLLHGWPQSWFAWRGVMAAGAEAGARMIAVDLPGIGESTGDPTDGSKSALAAVILDLVPALGLDRPVLVGHDCGGMIAWACLQAGAVPITAGLSPADLLGTEPPADPTPAGLSPAGLLGTEPPADTPAPANTTPPEPATAEPGPFRRVVIMDTVVPGLEPWDEVVARPYVWHFAFHAIPGLPETMVAGRERPYFDYFFDVLSPDPARIPEEARAAAVAAYQRPESLAAGFSWYQKLSEDAAAATTSGQRIDTPLRYLRGGNDDGELTPYLEGFRRAGVADVQGALIPGAGHFSPEEDPAAVWAEASGE
ncbi:alpha/beta hydrolase [Actinoplanes sp. NPDC051494]|uniref:alpha/beta hydrolase n=1 Tax=Actinoplanes sp. NPDC051494 TaxID=3363907 RepID=UPI0037956179